MNSRIQNHLNMIGACITTAQSADYQPVWNGQPPQAFGTDLAALATGYAAVTAKAAQAEAATGGAALVLQLDTTDAGHCFAEAWQRARVIVSGAGAESYTGSSAECYSSIAYKIIGAEPMHFATRRRFSDPSFSLD